MVRKMKDSGVEWIGEIPEDWEVKRLQWGLSEIVIKNDPIQTENILSLTKDRGVIPYKDKGNQGNKSKTDCKDYKLAYPDTIVMNSMNVIIGSVGICDYFGCVSPVYYVYKARENYDLRFFNYIFQIPKFQDELKKYANGILEIRLRVSSENVLKRQVAIPKYELQKKISDVLDKKSMEIDSIELYINQEIETLEAYKKSVITEAVTKGLDKSAEMKDSGIEYIGEKPINWDIKKVKYLITERIIRSMDGKGELLSVSQYKGVIPSSKNSMRTAQARSLIGYKVVKKGDLVFNKLNPELARFSVSEYDGITSPDYAVYIVNRSQVLEKFLEYVLKTDRYATEYGRVTLGVGDGFKRLYTNQLGCFFITCPSIEEQEEILSYLKKKTQAIDEVIAIKQNQLSVLDEYKKSLIYEYVTGKREV